MTKLSVALIAMLSLLLGFASALPAQADYNAGRAAWDAGRHGEAVRQWEAAARANDVRALLALGRAFAKGVGVPRDFIEAHKWLNLAAGRGSAEAAAERDALEARMTMEEQAEARKLARAWRIAAAPPKPNLQPKPMPPARKAEQPKTPAPAAPPPKRALREAQTLLARLGYKPGPADGDWGQRSVAAYRAFQRDAGMASGDTLTPATLRALRRAVRERRKAAQKADAAPSAVLHRLVKAGNLSGLKAALARGADVNARDSRGLTPLMHAANRGYVLLAPLLLEAGAKVDLRAPDGATALFMAAAHGHAEFIALLMKAGADPAISGPKGRTAIDVARLRYGRGAAVLRKTGNAAVLALVRGITLNEAQKAIEANRAAKRTIAQLKPKCVAKVTREGKEDSPICWRKLADRPGCYALGRLQFAGDLRWSGKCSGNGGLIVGKGTLRYKEKLADSKYTTNNVESHVQHGTAVDGKKNGLWSEQKTYTRNDRNSGNRYTNTNTNKITYKKGKREGIAEYRWGDGYSHTGPIFDGKKHGTWTKRKNGHLIDRGPFVNGKKHGIWVVTNYGYVDSRGYALPVETGPYVNGKKAGVWEKKWKGATFKGAYVDGKQDGVWVYTIFDGKRKGMISHYYYSNGNMYKTVVVRRPSRSTGDAGRTEPTFDR